MRSLMFIGALMCLVGCDPAYSYTPPLTHDHRYTIPFARDKTLVIWEPQEGSVELHKGTPVQLLAPGHTIVADVFQGEVTLTDPDYQTLLVLEGVDDVDVKVGDELCAGTYFGVTMQVRIKAFWGQEEDPLTRDMSMVRVVRNSVITDLSDMRFADRVHSALALPKTEPKNSDVNQDECPFGGE